MKEEPLADGWERVARPPALFRRFEFASYEQTRAFLDRLAELSKETGLYPDLGFAARHANVTIYGEGGTAPGAAERSFADRAAELAASAAG